MGCAKWLILAGVVTLGPVTAPAKAAPISVDAASPAIDRVEPVRYGYGYYRWYGDYPRYYRHRYLRDRRFRRSPL